MIRQIVFDMGNVLLRFDTMGAAAAHADSPADAELLRRMTIESPWWPAMDRGGAEKDALNGMLPDLPKRLHPNAEALLEDWDAFLFPLAATVDLAEELAGKGYDLYLLSNTPWRFRKFRGKLPVLEQFQGLVLSCEEGLLKPDPALYRRLFDRYGLAPEECFFIDDSSPNIECARYLGMTAHRFLGDAAALRRDLREKGVDVTL